MKNPILIALVLVVAAGCQSGKAQIADSANAVKAYTRAGRAEAVQLQAVVPEESMGHLKGVHGAFDGIDKEVDKHLLPALDRVVDKPGWFSDLKKWLKWLVVGLVALGALVAAGEFRLIPGLSWVVGWLAKKGLSFTRTSGEEAILAARMKAEMEASGQVDAGADALLAAKRAMSPTFNGRYIRAKNAVRIPNQKVR